jgi:hypothetical protein
MLRLSRNFPIVQPKTFGAGPISALLVMTADECASTRCARFVTKLGVRSELLKDATRLVVKVGTGVLTDSR